MISANRFRHRIAIQTRTKTRTAVGLSETWTTLETRWANVIPLTATLRARYQGMDAETTHLIRFRYMVQMTLGNHRLVWGTQILEPLGLPMDPQALHRFTELSVRVLSPEEAAQ